MTNGSVLQENILSLINERPVKTLYSILHRRLYKGTNLTILSGTNPVLILGGVATKSIAVRQKENY